MSSRIAQFAVILTVVYACVLAIVRRCRILRAHPMPRLHNVASFPCHVARRGFATAAFQERGGYASDAVVNGVLVHCRGDTTTDWTWRASDADQYPTPPPWAQGLLPLYFALGNGATEHMESDLRAMSQAGATAFRFSLCWARLQPRRNAPLDAAELAHVNHTVRRVKAHGMLPIITLCHFVLPEWVGADGGGWHVDATVDAFADFVQRVARGVESCVATDATNAANAANNDEYWITINEPNISVVHGYIAGTRPPGMHMSIGAAVHAYANQLRAHVLAAEGLRRTRRARVHASPAWNASVFAARNTWWVVDELLATALDALFNRSVLALLTRGSAWVANEYVQGEPPARVARPLFVAINCYTRLTCDFAAPWETPEVDHEVSGLDGETLPNDLRWDLSSQHLWSVLASVREAAPNARVFLAEHGIPDRADGVRRQLLRETASLLHACPHVGGYLHWSFASNVEWDLGWAGSFGVVAVDLLHRNRRIPRGSYHLLRRMWTRPPRQKKCKVPRVVETTLRK